MSTKQLRENSGMRTTTDTHTGKPFKYNTTASVETATGFVVVPARCTRNAMVHLHPTRTPTELLRELNQQERAL